MIKNFVLINIFNLNHVLYSNFNAIIRFMFMYYFDGD